MEHLLCWSVRETGGDRRSAMILLAVEQKEISEAQLADIAMPWGCPKIRTVPARQDPLTLRAACVRRDFRGRHKQRIYTSQIAWDS
jgi:hypothetical protein